MILDVNLLVRTSRAMDISMHQEPNGVTSAIAELAPTIAYYGSGGAMQCDNRGASRFSRILVKRTPGTSIRRVVSSKRLKTTENLTFSHLILYLHYKLSSEYLQKRRLGIQNRFRGCKTFMYPSIQTAGSTYAFIQVQSLSVPSTSLRSEHCPRAFTPLGHTVVAYSIFKG